MGHTQGRKARAGRQRQAGQGSVRERLGLAGKRQAGSSRGEGHVKKCLQWVDLFDLFVRLIRVK